VTASGSSVANTIRSGFGDFLRRFGDITRQAPARFAARDWRGLLDDATARLDVYNASVDEAVESIRGTLGAQLEDRAIWASAKAIFVEQVDEEPARELAETFFNSVTRRIFHTEGIDPSIEFVGADAPEPLPLPPDTVRTGGEDGCEAAFERLLLRHSGDLQWVNLARDVTLAAAELRRRLERRGLPPAIDGIETLVEPFYRGQGAYVVGRVLVAGAELPLAVVLHHTSRGLVIGALLADIDDLSVLFSYTRSSFLTAVRSPSGLVAYLQQLMPRKRAAELYTTIGFHKHGKTELYRDFMGHVATSADRFEHARGIKGMVMIVFTMPGYDVVFKVIRDRFPYPKQTTRRHVMGRYRLVFRHDRAGRMIETYEFEHLRFSRDRFTAELLDELGADATRSVSIDRNAVTLHHVYVERRVVPLDIYLREANPIKAQAAIVDYGRAIKNLAATNIFPGDMLLKNFGVTRSGRVVFYDYDEITNLTSCNFRELPDSDRPDDEMSADPWFGVGDDDVFPEEFAQFLGIRGELREVFDYYHSDLFGVRFWRRAQDRVRAGEVIEIFPYRRGRRLGAAARFRLGAVE
jgi:isocitrate dehydrogenase kinase/phosphatase